MVAAIAGCSGMLGPSVPFQKGKNFTSARTAVLSCAPNGPKGGKNAVVGSYVAGVLLGGLIVGPVVVASTEDSIRTSGAMSAVDRCLADLGYARRELTEHEVRVLNATSGEQRRLLLDHYVAGGSVETFEGVGV
ncbi:hypothetical protein GP644_17005 [Parasedimentitalea maritima]|uniref:Uncharacterized protein n=2 Tax=Parasedimentitalea maritima TaxID=2578117 RepID=A0A6A4RCL8_9RHOB|nr:hypothetical protein GP644_17005 [Zongyanglinia marina]